MYYLPGTLNLMGAFSSLIFRSRWEGKADSCTCVFQHFIDEVRGVVAKFHAHFKDQLCKFHPCSLTSSEHTWALATCQWSPNLFSIRTHLTPCMQLHKHMWNEEENSNKNGAYNICFKGLRMHKTKPGVHLSLCIQEPCTLMPAFQKPRKGPSKHQIRGPTFS